MDTSKLTRSPRFEDPELEANFRIGQLEEAIREALPEIEAAIDELEREKNQATYSELYGPSCYVTDARQVIANLKQLIQP